MKNQKTPGNFSLKKELVKVLCGTLILLLIFNYEILFKASDRQNLLTLTFQLIMFFVLTLDILLYRATKPLALRQLITMYWEIVVRLLLIKFLI